MKSFLSRSSGFEAFKMKVHQGIHQVAFAADRVGCPHTSNRAFAWAAGVCTFGDSSGVSGNAIPMRFSRLACFIWQATRNERVLVPRKARRRSCCGGGVLTRDTHKPDVLEKFEA